MAQTGKAIADNHVVVDPGFGERRVGHGSLSNNRVGGNYCMRFSGACGVALATGVLFVHGRDTGNDKRYARWVQSFTGVHRPWNRGGSRSLDCIVSMSEREDRWPEVSPICRRCSIN